MDWIAVVVEGKSDALLLRRLLEKTLEIPLRFYAADGEISLATVGRNILVHEGGPLVVVMDADTLERSRGDDARRMVGATLRSVAPGDRFEVFAFAPGLEVVFFEAPAVLLRRLGSKIMNRSAIERGSLQPKATLRGLLGGAEIAESDYFRGLTDQDLDDLRQGDQASQLIRVLESLAVAVG